mgnify:CR=1 FL=1
MMLRVHAPEGLLGRDKALAAQKALEQRDRLAGQFGLVQAWIAIHEDELMAD